MFTDIHQEHQGLGFNSEKLETFHLTLQRLKDQWILIDAFLKECFS